MEINTLLELMARRKEEYDIDKAPAVGNLGPYMTTAQAARELDVSMSRIRQFIADGKLKSYKPEKGRRDHMLKTSQVRAFKKKPRERTGRPVEDEKGSDD